MSSPNKKAAGGNPAASDNTIKINSRIPAAGFVALGHLLHASRTLHQLPALPDDALISADILMRRIESDLERLKGQRL